MSSLQFIKKSLIYQEFDDEQRSKFFSVKRSKFLAHIDSLYYTIFPDSKDWVNDLRKINFVADLAQAAQDAQSSPDGEVPIFEKKYQGLTCRAFMHFNMYKYHFSCKDFFDVFIADSVPNIKTPPVFVQIRSNALWIKGVKSSLDESLDIISRVLNIYSINVEKIVENRIDYAFHTNYIQDPIHFFPEPDLAEMQVSQFQRWHKEGYFYSNEVHCDYFTLGRRKSNNVFFRIYDKTKEVVEMGYKQFFLPIWRKEGLISNFDNYVLENTFMTGSWNAKERYRCKFYLIHGKDSALKREISRLLDNPETPFSSFKKIADTCVPDVTIICNIEFQCKRKFFYNLSDSVTELHISDDLASDRIYSIIEHTKGITQYLTYSIIRFVKYKNKDAFLEKSKRDMADWWKRLRSAKQYELCDYSFAEYCFAYQSNIDLQRIRNATIKAVARTSAYYDLDDSEFSVEDDFIDFCGHLNDNDVCVYNRAKLKARKDINAKKMKISEAAENTSDIYDDFKVKKFRDIYMYWLYGIFNKKLSEDVFKDVAFNAFYDSFAYDVFCKLKKNFDGSLSDFSGFASGVARRILEAWEAEQGEKS